MNNVTVISYPSSMGKNLLSLNDLRSRYMIPAAGKFRIADFVIRNSLACEASRTVIFSDIFDDLTYYIDSHPVHEYYPGFNISTVLQSPISVDKISEVISEKETKYYIFYNGDNPGIIDFNKVIKAYQKSKGSTILFKLKIDGKATMAHTVLMTDKRSFLGVLKKAKKEQLQAPNTFEMLINMIVNKGVKNAVYNAIFWPLNTVVDFYKMNMHLCKNNELKELLYDDPYLLRGIKVDQPAQIRMFADIKNSFISDGCIINGKVENSILFPGVIVGEKTIIRDSILLPYVSVDKGTKIENSIIDEFTDYSQSDVLFNISSDCSIGSLSKGSKNTQNPKALYDGLTLIGKNCIIPKSIKIGGACFIGSGCSMSDFSKNKTIHNTETHDPYVITPDKNI